MILKLSILGRSIGNADCFVAKLMVPNRLMASVMKTNTALWAT